MKPALKMFREIMEEGLQKAYDSMGAKRLGGVDEFICIVGKRDSMLGLKVKFKKGDNKFIYIFNTDPFPGLRGHVSNTALDPCYLDIKRDYFLGPEWNYKLVRHIWDGAPYTEWHFTKK